MKGRYIMISFKNTKKYAQSVVANAGIDGFCEFTNNEKNMIKNAATLATEDVLDNFCLDFSGKVVRPVFDNFWNFDDVQVLRYHDAMYERFDFYLASQIAKIVHELSPDFSDFPTIHEQIEDYGFNDLTAYFKYRLIELVYCSLNQFTLQKL